MHDLGGRSARRAALCAGRRHRRHDARTGPSARRNHGGDVRDRQRTPDFGVDLGAGTTISAVIANEFTEAVSPLYTSALIELGLILFVVTFIVLAIARYMLMRT